MPLARLFAAALAFALASAASAGVIIEGKDEDTPDQRFVMEGKKIRIDSGGGDAMIYDAGTKKAIQLDPSTKTWSEFTAEDVAKLRGAATGGAPAKTRTTKYVKTSATEKALGKTCNVYRVEESGGDAKDEEQTLCVAPFSAFGMTKADFAPFLAFGDFASEMSGGELERSWADLPGVPLIAWEKEGEEPRRETFRATKVEKRSVPASEFAVPAGWKQGPGFAEQMREIQEQMKQMQQDQGKPPGK